MKRGLRVLAASGSLLLTTPLGEAAFAQKQGGVVRMSHFDSPASMSLHEEATAAANRPMMGVFNNLVMYKQDVPQNSPQSIIPDLATGWSWSEEGTELTFPLRQGVKWHDGKLFTAADVKCTFDLLMGKSSDKLRVNPRKSWYVNVAEVTTNGDYETTFHLKRPQPSFLDRLVADLSLPRQPARHAQSPDRYRPVQICRVQAKPVDHGRPQSRLLEERATRSRRHRIHDHQGRIDPAADLYRRQGRSLFWGHDPAIEGCQKPGPRCDLQGVCRERQSQPDRQSRQASL